MSPRTYNIRCSVDGLDEAAVNLLDQEGRLLSGAGTSAGARASAGAGVVACAAAAARRVQPGAPRLAGLRARPLWP